LTDSGPVCAQIVEVGHEEIPEISQAQSVSAQLPGTRNRSRIVAVKLVIVRRGNGQRISGMKNKTCSQKEKHRK